MAIYIGEDSILIYHQGQAKENNTCITCYNKL